MPLRYVLLLGAFLLHNLVWMVVNQVSRSCQQKVCVSPRNLERVAAANPHPEVASRLAVAYWLGQRVPSGTTLHVPPWMEPHRVLFERVARLRVVVGAGPFVVTPAEAERLRVGGATLSRWLRRGGSIEPPFYQDLYLTLEPGVPEYVWAETNPTGDGPIVVARRRP